MKKILLMLAVCASVVMTVRATVVILVGGGITVPNNIITNFPQTCLVGTFTLSPQYLYLSQNGITNANFVINGQLSFDGSNRFSIPQTYVFATNGGLNGATNVLWAVTNITFPVYGMIQVSNGLPSNVSNFVVAIQQ